MQMPKVLQTLLQEKATKIKIKIKIRENNRKTKEIQEVKIAAAKLRHHLPAEVAVDRELRQPITVN